jgi:predicted alpha/beta hydrolase family esterase
MRTSEIDILIVPGWTGSGPDHWQSRWQDKLSTARRVAQADWDVPERQCWAAAVRAEVEASARPVVLVAHSCGVSAVAHAAASLPPGRVAGAFLVAPPSEAATRAEPALASFAPYPSEPLPFSSVLVASRTDPYCLFSEAEALARRWRASLVDAGDAGHLNTASGHGPWPEGLMRFAGFLKSLGPMQ